MVFSRLTHLLYWRDPGEPSQPFPCEELAQQHPWFPLNEETTISWDEQENPDLPESFPTLQPAPYDRVPFALHAGLVEVGASELPVPFDFGWLYADLGFDEGPTQSWIGTLMQAEGRFSAVIETTPLDDPCSPGRTPPDAE